MPVQQRPQLWRLKEIHYLRLKVPQMYYAGRYVRAKYGREDGLFSISNLDANAADNRRAELSWS